LGTAENLNTQAEELVSRRRFEQGTSGTKMHVMNRVMHEVAEFDFLTAYNYFQFASSNNTNISNLMLSFCFLVCLPSFRFPKGFPPQNSVLLPPFEKKVLNYLSMSLLSNSIDPVDGFRQKITITSREKC
jgi:hypothetical protein